jgi:hypothetical protein
VTTTTTTMLWRRLDQPGHDAARLVERADGARLEGTAVFAEAGRPCRLDYRVDCDASWRTVAARVVGWLDDAGVDVAIAVDGDRRWAIDGQPCPAVAGCDDVDLSFTPATNLLAIRRTRLGIGDRILVRAAWLDFPVIGLQPLEQSYQRLSDTTWRYESGGGTFTARLETGAAGFVTAYPGLWQQEL